MLWAYDSPGIKGEHLKLNTVIKEVSGSREGGWRTGGAGPGREGGGSPAQRTEVSPGLMPWHARKDSWTASLSKWLILKPVCNFRMQVILIWKKKDARRNMIQL